MAAHHAARWNHSLVRRPGARRDPVPHAAQPATVRVAAPERVRGGFHSQHGIHRLVWMELHANRLSAIAREKTLEEWRRAWKTALNEQDKLPA